MSRPDRGLPRDELAAERDKLQFEFSDIGFRILKNFAKHQDYRPQIYDAALNNFARLSMFAALASPITK